MYHIIRIMECYTYNTYNTSYTIFHYTPYNTYNTSYTIFHLEYVIRITRITPHIPYSIIRMTLFTYNIIMECYTYNTYNRIWYMGWLRLVGSLKWLVCVAAYSLFHRVLLQKRRIYYTYNGIHYTYNGMGWLRLV